MEQKPLIFAAAQGDSDLVKTLVMLGHDIRQEHDCPLYMACTYDHVKVARYCLKKGADPNAQDGAPMREACKKGNLDIVKLLFEYGATVDERVIAICERYKSRNADILPLVKSHVLVKNVK
jgi:ankyrin repeat protein